MQSWKVRAGLGAGKVAVEGGQDGVVAGGELEDGLPPQGVGAGAAVADVVDGVGGDAVFEGEDAEGGDGDDLCGGCEGGAALGDGRDGGGCACDDNCFRIGGRGCSSRQLGCGDLEVKFVSPRSLS